MDSYETPTYVSLQVHNKTSSTHATPLANTVGSCLAILDGEERRNTREERATTEDVPDTTIEDLFHEFNSGYKHEGKY